MIIEKTIKFEVAEKDLERTFTWDEAMNETKALGDGWRLPTKEELNIICEKHESIGGFASASYWSSSEYYSYDAWLQYFGIGNQAYYSGKGGYGRVRVVRDVAKDVK